MGKRCLKKGGFYPALSGGSISSSLLGQPFLSHSLRLQKKKAIQLSMGTQRTTVLCAWFGSLTFFSQEVFVQKTGLELHKEHSSFS